MSVRGRLVRRIWPVGSIDLLLRAGAGPEGEARTLWARWVSRHDFDRLTWAEKRLVAGISERIVALDPASEFAPRIEGLAKHLWTSTQLAMLQAADAFDALSRAGVSFVLLKGAALHAEGLGPSCRRIMGDVDLLVRRDAAHDAIDALTGAGWASSNGESPAYLRRLAKVRLSGNYRKGRYGDVDLHISAFHFSKDDAALDEAFWRSSRPAALALRPLLVPDPENAIVIGLSHAPFSDNGDWALDIVTRLSHQSVDWERLASIAAGRGLTLQCLGGLSYLHEVLGIAIPESVIADLARAPVAASDWTKFWSNASARRDRNLPEKVLNRLADRFLRRRGFTIFEKDWREVTVTRPRRVGFRRGTRALPVGSPAWDFVHDVVLGKDETSRRLFIELAIVEPPVSRRVFFDVTADGVAIARLRGRAGRSKKKERHMTYALPVPASGGDVVVSIEARPAGFLPPHADPALRAAMEATRFRLVAAWTG